MLLQIAAAAVADDRVVIGLVYVVAVVGTDASC